MWKSRTFQSWIFVKEKVAKRTYDNVGKLTDQILGLNDWLALDIWWYKSEDRLSMERNLEAYKPKENS